MTARKGAMGPTLRVWPGGRGAVRIEGKIDACVADRVQQLLLRIVRMHGPRLLLDLSAVSFIDCAGLRGTCASGEPEHLEYYMIDPSTYRDE